jgi:hypothetical protein
MNDVTDYSFFFLKKTVDQMVILGYTEANLPYVVNVFDDVSLPPQDSRQIDSISILLLIKHLSHDYN